MKIKFGVGDECADGHGMKDVEILEVTGTKDLEEDYNKGVKKIGYDLTKYCNEYEDNKIPKAMILKIRNLGFECKIDDFDDYDKDVPIYSETYLDIYMTIAKIGNGKIGYEITGDGIQYIHPGGYGCFSM